MKTCLAKFFAWLPIGFFLLLIGTHIYYENGVPLRHLPYIFSSGLAGLAFSLIIAAIALPFLKSPLTGWHKIYKWYLAIPVGILLILVWLASLSR